MTENQEKDGYELKFPGKPTEAVLALFHETKTLPGECRWHWHFKKKVWYAKRNEATREFAQLVISQSSGLAEVVPVAAAVQAEAPEPAKQTASAPPKFAGGGDPIPLNVEHSIFSRPMWALEVQDGSTRLGYEEWVEAKVTLAYEAAEPPEPEEVAAPVPENVILASFTPPEPVRTELSVTQKPEPAVPDWRNRFSWSRR
jgi:hypothetical protein